jgi:predicted DNA-binding helix-hairpin-helix protein
MRMDDLDRLQILCSQMHLEPTQETSCPKLPPHKKDSVFVSNAILPNGSRIKLLKTLLTSVCEQNCYYCPFRVGRDFRRATFTPDEFARLFLDLHRADIANGLFLSSGILNGGVFTQDKLIATADLLRKKYHYNGYIHLKIMPGAEKAQVEAAMLLADRVSINLEAPNTERLHQLAPKKEYLEELLQPLQWINDLRRTQPGDRAWKGYWPSSVTQFVVGAVGETDLELLSTTQSLYNQQNLKRAYFSAFSPIPDTPFENQVATSPVREHRLYEASFLIRDYGYDFEELPFDSQGNLPLQADPKLLWAQNNLSQPIELNRADRHELMRIPGIGAKGVNSILNARRNHKLNDISELRRMGINIKRAAPFILLNGARPMHQLSFL